MVSCGAKKDRGFLGGSRLSIRLPPYTQLIMERNLNENTVPGSRMARGLRASARLSESARGAEDPDGVAAGPSQTTIRTSQAEVDSLEEEMVSCEQCSARFRNMRGLGVHKVRAHPLQANSAINVDRVKARWSVEETRLMARAEAEGTLAGELFINQYLETRFPNRSLEAIKGKRQQEPYRVMVRDFCQEIQSRRAIVIDEGDRDGAVMTRADTIPAATEASTDDQSAHQPSPEQSSQRLRDKIQSLVEQSAAFRSYEADTLAGTARDALTAGRVDVLAIKRWLGMIFPRPLQVRPPQRVSAKKHCPPVKRESREQRRKREYAIVQSLYKKNKKSCLSRILEGDSVRERPSAVEFFNCWRPIMEASSGADGDMTDLRESFGEAAQAASAGRGRTSSLRGIHLEGLGDGAATDPVPVADKTLLWDSITPAEVNRISVRTGTAPGWTRLRRGCGTLFLRFFVRFCSICCSWQRRSPRQSPQPERYSLRRGVCPIGQVRRSTVLSA